MRDETIVERPAEQTTLTRRYTEEAIQMIESSRSDPRPFFLYLAHNMPHVPLFTSDDFAGHSARGLYGDVIEEIDWSVGAVLDSLRDVGIAERTLVVFTSDNGPWLVMRHHGGDAGPLRNGKGTTWEGGMRVPGVVWWPNTIQPAVSHEIVSTLDLLPTFAALAGADRIEDRPIDGFDLSPFLRGEGANPRRTLFYYRGEELFAVRDGRYKVHYRTASAFGIPDGEPTPGPQLYDLQVDPGERFDISADHPEVLERMSAIVARHKETMTFGKNQLARSRPP
jgi:uncharacterized sulfatase